MYRFKVLATYKEKNEDETRFELVLIASRKTQINKIVREFLDVDKKILHIEILDSYIWPIKPKVISFQELE